MWTYAKALRVMKTYIEASTDDEGALLENETLDKPYGWVFFYQTRAFIRTGDFNQAYAGNAPLIFDRFSGEIRKTGTARPIEHYLAEYESTVPPARLTARPLPRERDDPPDPTST